MYMQLTMIYNFGTRLYNIMHSLIYCKCCSPHALCYAIPILGACGDCNIHLIIIITTQLIK